MRKISQIERNARKRLMLLQTNPTNDFFWTPYRSILIGNLWEDELYLHPDGSTLDSIVNAVEKALMLAKISKEVNEESV